MKADERAAAVEMLTMPPARTLDDDQIEGRQCVWCPTKLDDTGIRLGPRIRVTGAGVLRWLPRACRACVGREAARVYAIHVRTCARCSHRDYCPDSHALHKLALEYR